MALQTSLAPGAGHQAETGTRRTGREEGCNHVVLREERGKKGLSAPGQH